MTQVLESRESNGGLSGYLEENRDRIETLADSDLPISNIMQCILDRDERGEL